MRASSPFRFASAVTAAWLLAGTSLAAPTLTEEATPPTAALESGRIRCWQEGLLVFEKDRLEDLRIDPGARVVLRSTRPGGRAVVLIEAGVTICLLEGG